MSTEVNTTQYIRHIQGSASRGSSWGVMEGFLEEVLATARPGNQEDTGLAMNMCGCRERQRGRDERQCTQRGGYPRTICTQCGIDRELGRVTWACSTEQEGTHGPGGAVQSSAGASSRAAFLATGGDVTPSHPGCPREPSQDDSPAYELFEV